MATETSVGVTLYRRALGAPFESLPEPLRRFHAAPNGSVAQGRVCVTRPAGLLHNVVANLMRLPPSSRCLDLTLNVMASDDGEIWTRNFGGHSMVTYQRLWNGLLLERSGPVTIAFRVEADERGLRFTFVRAWLLGFPLPYVFSPRVGAEAIGTARGWTIDVSVRVPLVGEVARYRGEITPQC